MHNMGMGHQDIKPQNLLVFKTEHGIQGKLADFSLATGKGLLYCSL